MQLHDWAMLVGIVVNLFLGFKVAWSVGKWQGEINANISDLKKRLDEFTQKYGDLPERVSYMEGILQGGPYERNKIN
jgi:hypothetical protein